MKTLIASIFALVLFSCSQEPELNDPLEGNWSYTSLDLSGQKPVIKATFSVVRSGDSYVFNNLEISVDGAKSTDYSTVLTGVETGDKIGKIKFSNGSNIIEMTNADHLIAHPSWFVEKVQIEKGNQVYTYTGASILIN